MEIKIPSIDIIDESAKQFIEYVFTDEFMSKKEKCVAFYGKMGTGKTTFIKSICKVLGVTDNVNSPSFAIINEYQSGKFETIFHFDFYRIKNQDEAFDFGYEDYFYSGNLCLIEWPEKIEALLPENTTIVRITEMENGARTLKF